MEGKMKVSVMNGVRKMAFVEGVIQNVYNNEVLVRLEKIAQDVGI